MKKLVPDSAILLAAGTEPRLGADNYRLISVLRLPVGLHFLSGKRQPSLQHFFAFGVCPSALGAKADPFRNRILSFLPRQRWLFFIIKSCIHTENIHGGVCKTRCCLIDEEPHEKILPSSGRIFNGNCKRS